MKILCFDGPENVGKTFTLKVLKKMLERNYPNWSVVLVHFPGDDVCNSEVFKEMVEPHEGLEPEKRFIDLLIEKEKTFFKNFEESRQYEKTILLIDRFIFSSLVYQGSKSPEMEKYVLEKYEEMFNLSYDLRWNLYHIIFMTQMGVEEGVENESKRILDSQNDITIQKYRDLLYKVQFGLISSKDMFKNLEIIDVSDITQGKLPDYTQKSLILSVQLDKILRIIHS